MSRARSTLSRSSGEIWAVTRAKCAARASATCSDTPRPASVNRRWRIRASTGSRSRRIHPRPSRSPTRRLTVLFSSRSRAPSSDWESGSSSASSVRAWAAETLIGCPHGVRSAWSSPNARISLTIRCCSPPGSVMTTSAEIVVRGNGLWLQQTTITAAVGTTGSRRGGRGQCQPDRRHNAHGSGTGHSRPPRPRTDQAARIPAPPRSLPKSRPSTAQNRVSPASDSARNVVTISSGIRTTSGLPGMPA